MVFFLDRNHGALVRDSLKRSGFGVILCSHTYAFETKDVTWIAECAKNNWIIISGDKRIERVPEERQAVIEGKCKVFMFEDSNSSAENWAAAILVGKQRIAKLVEEADGPFFVTLKKYGHGHVTLPRFVPGVGAGWKIVEQQPVKPLDTPIKKRPTRKQQRNFEFPPDKPGQIAESSAVDQSEEIMIDIATRQPGKDHSMNNVPADRPCQSCQGKGKRGEEQCDVCGGSGRRPVDHIPSDTPGY